MATICPSRDFASDGSCIVLLLVIVIEPISINRPGFSNGLYIYNMLANLGPAPLYSSLAIMTFIAAETKGIMMRAVDGFEKAAEILVKLAVAAGLGIVGLIIGAWSFIGMGYALSPHALPSKLGASGLWSIVLGITFSYTCVFGGIVLFLSSIVEKRIVRAIWLVATNLFLLTMAGFVIVSAVDAQAVGKLAPGSTGSIVILCVCLSLYPAITVRKQMKRHD